MSNIDDTLAERGSRYGEFVDHAGVTQSIKVSIASGNNWHTMDDDMKECLEMVAHKIGRIVNGDPYYVDSWTDIIGYTRLVEKRLIAENEPPLDEDEDDYLEDCPCSICAGARAEQAKQDAKAAPKVAKSKDHPSFNAVADALALLIKAGVIHPIDDEQTA